MKRILRLSVVLMLLVEMSGAASAEENVKAVAGLKTWINSWKSDKAGSGEMRSNTTALVGWSAEAEFSNRLFAEVSYLLSAVDYKFDLPGGVSEVERNDFDLVVGYRSARYAGVFTGYRSSQFLQKQGNSKSKVTLHGPLIGICQTAPLNSTFSLFGKVTYLPQITKRGCSEFPVELYEA